MPIVDGLTSTKMIRSFEESHPDSILSPRELSNGRVSIFAVSASLVERDRQTYIDAGFDGWILKPIDFKRLNALLQGIVDDKIRDSCLYQPGQWERGGWFHRRQPTSALHASTAPSSEKPAFVQSDDRDKTPSRGNSESGSITTTETKRRLIHDERLDVPRAIEEESSPAREKLDGESAANENDESTTHVSMDPK